MAQNSTEEVDLIFLYRKVKAIVKHWVVLLFRVIDYTLRNWKIVSTLIIVGLGLGIYSKLNTKPSQKANLIVRVNFDAVNYMYSAIDLLNAKIKDKDTFFLSKIGLRKDTLEIKKIEMIPHISIKDILDKYDPEDRRFEPILRNLDLSELFDDNETLFDQTYIAEYKFHSLRLYLSSSATEKTVKTLLNYLNNNEFLQELKTTTIKNLEDHLANNTKMISQIDRLLDAYYTNESLASPAQEIYVVDKNFSVANLLEQKIDLNLENENIKKELVYSKDTVVLINSSELAEEDKGLTSNKMIFYPFVFVFIFLFISYIRYSYRYLREMSKNS